MKLKIERILYFFVVSLFILFSPFLFSLDSEALQITALKISQPITVDGYLKETLWKRAHFVNNFIQKEPNEGAPATERTEIRVLFDDLYLYIGVVCFDSEPDKIEGRIQA
ncbi:unnamed protein product, partial [marine sediment metagenome]